MKNEWNLFFFLREIKEIFPIYSGTDFETAKQTLIANNYNLEQAINYHLERTNALNAPENDVAGKEHCDNNKKTVFFIEIFFSSFFFGWNL